MVRQQKKLVPTEKGLALHSVVKNMAIANVEMTGKWAVSYTHLNTIKRIWKQSVLKDFQHSQYIKLENGYSAHEIGRAHV